MLADLSLDSLQQKTARKSNAFYIYSFVVIHRNRKKLKYHSINIFPHRPWKNKKKGLTTTYKLNTPERFTPIP